MNYKIKKTIFLCLLMMTHGLSMYINDKDFALNLALKNGISDNSLDASHASQSDNLVRLQKKEYDLLMNS